MARQNFIGLVVSQGKMNKTVKVQVERKTFNRIINKEIMKRKNFLVHDEGNVAREGDLVRIEACRPLSAKKHFAIAEIRKNKGSQFAKYDQIAKEQVFLEENAKTKEFLDRRTKIEQDIQNNSSLISDLAVIRKGVDAKEGDLTQEELQKISALKEKYGIKSWPPQSEILQLEIQSVSERINDLRNTIDFVEPALEILVKEQYESKVNSVLQGFSKQEPDQLKKNIRKNILRKYLLTNPEQARDQFKEELSILN
ncbi:hypothetical protein WICMUC_003336 [Wickerhamomyces mucosus]|uniref:37S ribosomal protein S17, mitochondrial n=1 Tax=Wickerhamomyces mucosus TaxID=1378264 RepID=A0A9P8PLS3_9ASCO|nr:hypothetical protein WICMUC_003336 [Wickerhamomyces mucosus]